MSPIEAPETAAKLWPSRAAGRCRRAMPASPLLQQGRHLRQRLVHDGIRRLLAKRAWRACRSRARSRWQSTTPVAFVPARASGTANPRMGRNCRPYDRGDKRRAEFAPGQDEHTARSGLFAPLVKSCSAPGQGGKASRDGSARLPSYTLRGEEKIPPWSKCNCPRKPSKPREDRCS